MSRPRPDPVGGTDQPTETLVKAINAAHEVFQARHNWLSPLTSDEERRQFIRGAVNGGTTSSVPPWTQSVRLGTTGTVFRIAGSECEKMRTA